MKLGDLTTLANVKTWLATNNYTSTGAGVDAVLSPLISRWSNAILAELERPWILPKSYVNDAYDGDGGTRQFVRNWPINSISQLAISGRIVPPSPIVPGSLVGNNFGYRFEEWDGVPPGGPQEIEVIGIRYYPGRLNVQVSYNAGYLVSDEPWTIPAPISPATNPQIQAVQPYGIWAQDSGVLSTATPPVTYTAIPYNVSALPSVAGTYTIIPPDTVMSAGPPEVLAAPGTYIFAAADQGNTVTISYGFIPNALEQIAIELVCERFLYRGRIGEISRTQNAQVTAKYDTTNEFPKYAMPVLQRYRSILPL